MKKLSILLLLTVLVLGFSNKILAYPNGVSGYTLKTNSAGCGSCHGTHSSATSTISVVISGPSTLAPDAIGTYKVTISGGSGTKVGTDIACSNGTLATVDNNLKVSGGELTHPSAKSFSGGQYVFNFTYKAPSVTGTQTLYATGMSKKSQWNFASNFSIEVAQETMNAPSSLEAVFDSNSTSINLSWLDNSTNETNFVIERKVGTTGSFEELVQLDSNVISYIDTNNIQERTDYFYRIYSKNNSLISDYSDTVKVSIGTLVDVKTELSPTITNFQLNQNYPNPFNPSTVISYTIPEAGYVELKVYDIVGNLISTLVNENEDAGSYNISFSSNAVKGNLSSGIYFYTLALKSNNKLYTETKKALLIK